ncbi:uncharacterized protein [Venturia canescens]|uniref:uncharacterized protein n=1 Tax=Venturia canescens TaxID=32260 RepID=UPI001C9C5587|nr:uncharacterized protein LOC122410759 [Venturia canescens]
MGENVDDCDSAAPPYNVTFVTNSMAALAIANTTTLKPKLSKNKILELRRGNKVVCPPHNNQPLRCRYCLIDIVADPCETTNLFYQHYQTSMELSDIIRDYRKVLLPRHAARENFSSNSNFVGGTWMPWLTVEGNPLPR